MMELKAIPNANDNQVFDLVEAGKTNNVWASINREIFWTSNKEAHDALRAGKTLILELRVADEMSGAHLPGD
jgi:hypothetical protein